MALPLSIVNAVSLPSSSAPAQAASAIGSSRTATPMADIIKFDPLESRSGSRPLAGEMEFASGSETLRHQPQKAPARHHFRKMARAGFILRITLGRFSRA